MRPSGTAMLCLAVLAIAGCATGPAAVESAGTESAPAASAATAAPGGVTMRCSGQAGVLFSDYAGGTAVDPPTDGEARAAVRTRVADPTHPLHGERLQLTVAPDPDNGRWVVVTAAGPAGPSRFFVSRGANRRAQVTTEQICRPARVGPVVRASTRLPRAAPKAGRSAARRSAAPTTNGT